MEDKIHINFEMEQQMCTNCKKSSSEYYELKLQIRFENFNNIDIIKSEVTNFINSKDFNINKMIELKKGYDIYLRDLNDKIKISKLFRKKYFIEEIVSKKIIGHDFLKSKDMYRYTQLIKIINIKKNDIIFYKDKKYYVFNFNKNDLILKDIKTGSKTILTYKISKDYIKFDFNN